MKDKFKKICCIENIYDFLIIFWGMICSFEHPLPAFLAALTTFSNNKYVRLLPIPIIYVYEMFYAANYLEIAIHLIVISILLLYRSKRNPEVTNKVYVLLLSMAALMLTDFSQHWFLQGFLMYVDNNVAMAIIYRKFSVLIPYFLIFVIDALVKNTKKSCLIVFNIDFMFMTVNYFVTSITNNSFTLGDILNAKTAFGVMEGVQVKPGVILYFLLVLALVILFNIAVCKLPFKESNPRRAIFSGAMVAFMVFLLLGRNILMFQSANLYGLPVHLIASTKSVSEPENYEEFIKDYETDVKDTKIPNTDSPNVIVVVNEAFSDLSVNGDLKTNKEATPYINSLIKESGMGYLYASVHGNNTATSEYECLSGTPSAFTASGCEIYTKHMKDNSKSIVSSYGDAGYTTIGIHPYKGAGYNRLNAWSMLGFDKTYFIEDMKNYEKVRKYCSDKSFYEKIINEYKNTNGKKFIFGLSMQNHATYIEKYKGEIEALNYDYDDVDQYLSLIHETDNATKDFIDYFKNQDEETIIIFFGDHQPMVDSYFYSEICGNDLSSLKGIKRANAYKVPYFIWSNKKTIKAPKMASFNYLAKIIEDNSVESEDGWTEFTSKVYKKYPVITANFIYMNGKFKDKDKIMSKLDNVEYGDTDNPLYLLKKYQVYSYYRAIGSQPK